MGIQPITAPPPTTATLTLTVRAITDIDGRSTGHTGAIDAPTMPGLMAGAFAALLCPPIRLGISPGILAVAVGTQAPAAYLTTCAFHRRPRSSYGPEGAARAPGSRRRLIEPVRVMSSAGATSTTTICVTPFRFTVS